MTRPSNPLDQSTKAPDVPNKPFGERDFEGSPGQEQPSAEREEPPTYRGYHISYDPPPIPYRGFDWHFVHQDYDEGDNRYGSCASEAECRAEIDEIEDDK